MGRFVLMELGEVSYVFVGGFSGFFFGGLGEGRFCRWFLRERYYFFCWCYSILFFIVVFVFMCWGVMIMGVGFFVSVFLCFRVFLGVRIALRF